MIRTRFAPSPTGYLHIGSARTALFNYLFAKHHKGSFLLRIEDTDQKRSTEEAVKVIFEGLKWLDINWDDPPIFQLARSYRHKEIAEELIARGKAYFCYESQEEVNLMRDKAISEGKSFIFKSKWRDNKLTPPHNISPVIRLKAPSEGYTIIDDLVQGEVKVANDHLDDLILLRSDGTPTYMLAVVVDDYDMNISHVIRGDDHLTNCFKQKLIYEAMGWDIPKFAHIPMIHGPDGHKLSKRHGAVSVMEYKDMGYLPEAINNYLLRLGWSHGNDEIIYQDQAIEYFNLESVGKSPSRLDFDKMLHLNAHYIKNYDDLDLTNMITENLRKEYEIDNKSYEAILAGLPGLKVRARLLPELFEQAKIYLSDFKVKLSEDKKNIIKENKKMIDEIIDILSRLENYDIENIKGKFKEYSEKNNIKLADLMAPIRLLLTGSESSPSVFEIISILKKDTSLARLGYIN